MPYSKQCPQGPRCYESLVSAIILIKSVGVLLPYQSDQEPFFWEAIFTLEMLCCVFFSQPTFHIILVSKLVCLIMFKLIHYAFTGIRLASHWDLFYFITKRQNSSNFCSDSLVCCVLQQTVEGSNSVQDSWYGKSRSRLTCIKVHDDTLFGCAEV